MAQDPTADPDRGNAGRSPTIVITGASGGIGRSVALGLAARGPIELVMIARRRQALDAVAAEVASAGAGRHATVLVGDLELRSEVARLAAEVGAAFPRIEGLVNNAGAWFHRRHVTAEGTERTWALNVLAPLLLTERLRPSLRAGAPARVVMVSSEAHRGHRLRLDDLDGGRRYRGFSAYGRSKLALIAITEALADRYRGDGISVNALHPGFIDSGFGRNNGGWVRTGIALLETVAGRSPEYGARGPVRLLTDPSLAGTTGRYFVRGRPSIPGRGATDRVRAELVWRRCAEIAGIPDPGPFPGRPTAPA